ncbi:MAG: hypothetical protein INH02_16085 [Gemmatimonas sp.]|uniref:hypothetical protein n=1 Tax=Gemmatimonas sp. TaxID=1962908 RepID=UPI0025C16375|nr:hypothetical protein [Gemmatimonas sp.]MCA2988932.1 hypothetical protein [Gemmatimonas sp.]
MRQTLRRTRNPRDYAVVLAAVILEGDPERLGKPIELKWAAEFSGAQPLWMRFRKLRTE